MWGASVSKRVCVLLEGMKGGKVWIYVGKRRGATSVNAFRRKRGGGGADVAPTRTGAWKPRGGPVQGGNA